MLLYKFFFDGVEVESPIEWDQMSTLWRLSRDIKARLKTLDGEFTWTQDGYDHLKAKQDSGWFQTVDVLIRQSTDAGNNYRDFFKGIIKIADVEFMSPGPALENSITVERYARTKLFDNSFFGKIYSGKSQKANLVGGKSVNNQDITPCTVHPVRFFDPSNGAWVAPTQTQGGILWIDAFRYLIEFMTDSEVEFDSDLFTTGDFSQVVLTYGYPIRRTGQGVVVTSDLFKSNFPNISFADLFKACDRRCNLGLFVDNSGLVPKVRIERWDDIFEEDSVFQLSNINNIVTRVSVDELFAVLKIGSNKSLNQPNLSFPGDTKWIGFKAEEYNAMGRSQEDISKDLHADIVVDTNIIEQILINDPTDTTYDKDHFFVACTLNAGVYESIGTNWIDNGVRRFYNEIFTNYKIAGRFLKAVPNDIADFLGTGDDTFQATATQTQSYPTSPYSSAAYSFGIARIRFADDYSGTNFDRSNRYGNGTPQGNPVSTVNSIFTAPTGGSYQMHAEQKILLNVLRSTLRIEYTASLGTLTSGDIVTFHNSSGTQVGAAVVFSNNFIAGSQYRIYIGNQTGATALIGLSIRIGATVYGVITGTDTIGLPTTSGTINLVISHYNAASVLIADHIDTYNIPHSAGTQTLSFHNTRTLNLSATDYVLVYSQINQPGYVKISAASLAGSVFKCINSVNGGGVYQRYDPNDYPIFKDTFSCELTKTQMDLIEANPKKLIEYSQGSQTYVKAWIEDLRYNHFTGMAEFKMLRAKNTN